MIPYRSLTRINRLCKQHGLREATVRALCFIRIMDGKARATEIAKELDVSSAAVTGILDSLETLGYILRTHCTVNRRDILLSTTEQGKQAIEKIGIKAEPNTPPV